MLFDVPTIPVCLASQVHCENEMGKEPVKYFVNNFDCFEFGLYKNLRRLDFSEIHEFSARLLVVFVSIESNVEYCSIHQKSTRVRRYWRL